MKEIDNNHNEEFKVDNINLGNDINEKNDEKKNKITREDNNKKEKMESMEMSLIIVKMKWLGMI